MKLGSKTGSVVNHLRSRQTIGQPEPVVGMGATILLWSDRHAATVTYVFIERKLTCVQVRQDDAKVISGSTHDGSAVYEYTSNKAGSPSIFRREASGEWVEVRPNWVTGRWNKVKGHGLHIGEREEYRDPSS